MLSQGQAQWLVEFMRHLPGGAPQQAQVDPQAMQQMQMQQQMQMPMQDGYGDYPEGYQGYDAYSGYEGE